MDKYSDQFTMTISQHGNPEDAASMKKYLKNKFEFYGVKAHLLRELAKPYFQKKRLPHIDDVPD